MKILSKTILLLIFWGISFFAQASPPDTIKTAVKINAEKTFCVDTSSFAGNMVSMTDICSANSGTAVNYILNQYCLTYGGLDLGTEQACLVYCDDTGACDTTIFIVTVVPDSIETLPPIAVDDQLTTFENTPVDIDILANDLLPNNGDYNSLQLIQQAQHGVSILDGAGQLTYAPETGFCGASDTMIYEICNITACDQAAIIVSVTACVDVDGLLVYDGFSPNDDQINDKWKIYGLNEFPDHHIYVYNRWGNLVFEAQNYQNDWDGTWDATPLPPGTYYYIIDDGKRKRYKGYLQIAY